MDRLCGATAGLEMRACFCFLNGRNQIQLKFVLFYLDSIKLVTAVCLVALFWLEG